MYRHVVSVVTLTVVLSISTFGTARAELDMTQRIKLAASNADPQQSLTQLEGLVREADENSDENFRVYFGALGRAHLSRAYANVNRWKDCADTMEKSIKGYGDPLITKWLKTAELIDSLSVEHARCVAGTGRIDEAIATLTGLKAKGVKDANKVLAEVEAFQQSQANSAKLMELRDQAIKRAGEVEAKGDLVGALGIYAAAMQASLPNNFDTKLAQRAAALVKRIRSLPPVPDEARRHGIYGQTALKNGKERKDYEEAAKELSHALALAPWWRDVYLNLGLAFELMGNNSNALEMMRAYALIAPKGEATKVKDKIYELEFKTKQTAR